MTDPWDAEATRIHAERTRKAAEAEQAAREHRAKEIQERTEAEAAYRELQAAIADTVPQLEAFLLGDRAAAAQRLLAAYGERAHVMFGSESEGGSYHSVFLHADGLRYEQGVSRGYGTTPTENRPASSQEAVEYFARYGAAQRNPQAVRDIVAWLINKIDAYVRS